MILLLLEYGALVNSTNKRNSTALYSAIIAGKEEAVKVLLERGADVNIVDIVSRWNF
jgi:ankyrin repeat protein